MKPRLLLITNTANGCEEDSKFLAPALAKYVDSQIVSVTEAMSLLAAVDVCLLRNVWPFRLMQSDLKLLGAAIKQSGVPCCNPVDDTLFVEDKSYLADLTREGFPVVPTVLDKRNVACFGSVQDYLIKPLGGCSSDGVRRLSATELASTDSAGHVVQPYLELKQELSFFYIDNVFVYALRTKSGRWDMELWSPSAEQLAWVKRFVDWNAMPHGVQRVDVAVTTGDAWLLMEIEDIAPFLSLHMLPPDLLQSVTEQVAQSLLRIARKS